MATLLESASLFEVSVPEYKQLRMCRRESLLLKMLWDFVYIVRTSIDDWKTTLWREINVEQMDIDCNRFSKDIKLLDKEVRTWNVYTGAESTVRNMMTSLKAVTELQNSAIRERHWQQLMKATGVRRHIKLFFFQPKYDIFILHIHLSLISRKCHIAKSKDPNDERSLEVAYFLLCCKTVLSNIFLILHLGRNFENILKYCLKQLSVALLIFLYLSICFSDILYSLSESFSFCDKFVQYATKLTKGLINAKTVPRNLQ